MALLPNVRYGPALCAALLVLLARPARGQDESRTGASRTGGSRTGASRTGASRTGASRATSNVRIPPGLNLIAAEGARRDLDQLRATFESSHGALSRFLSPQELDRRLAGYRASIKGPITQFALLGLVSRWLADVGDGHARAGLDSASARRFSNVPLFPLLVRIESGQRLIVVNNASAGSNIAPGAELLRINGRPTADLLTTLAAFVPHDGVIESGRDARLARNFPSLLHWFADRATTFKVETREPDGTTRSESLAGITDAARAQLHLPINTRFDSLTKLVDGPPENITVRFVDNAVAVLRIRGFGGARFRTELDSVMSLIATRNAPGVVLDLRGNGGGVDLDGAALVSQFTALPFRYFDRIHINTRRPSFTTFPAKVLDDLSAGTTPDPTGGWLATSQLHGGVAEQAPALRPFLGKLVVLIDGNTFSTAADAAAALRGLNRAIFVGEETGGAYEGNTSGLAGLLYLPHSGIRVIVNLYGYYNAVPAPRVRARGIIPDVAIPWRASDVLRGEDPALTRAIAVAQQTRR